MTRFPSSRLPATLLLCLAACSGNAHDKSEASAAGESGTASTAAAVTSTLAEEHATKFLTDALEGDNSEMKLGQLAAEKGSSDAVRAYGRTLVADHRQARDEAAQVATAMNVAVPDAAMPEAEAEYTKLRGLSGAAFDREFVSYMVDDHRKDVAEFREEAASSDQEAVRNLATQTLPALNKHLEIALSLQQAHDPEG